VGSNAQNGPLVKKFGKATIDWGSGPLLLAQWISSWRNRTFTVRDTLPRIFSKMSVLIFFLCSYSCSEFNTQGILKYPGNSENEAFQRVTKSHRLRPSRLFLGGCFLDNGASHLIHRQGVAISGPAATAGSSNLSAIDRRVFSTGTRFSSLDVFRLCFHQK
jgi:hypothetical protein